MSQGAKPAILVADDDLDVQRALEFHLRRWGYRVRKASSRQEMLVQLAEEVPASILLDLRLGEHDGLEMLEDLMSRFPTTSVVMLTAHGSIESAVSAIKRGAYDYLTKPPDLNRLELVVDHACEKNRLARRIERLEQLVESDNQPRRPLWGESPAMRQVRELVASVAPTEASVIVTGESGTGKELVARALHDLSQRSHGPFIPVNMAAIPRELVESTLFGHERGAFTGADQTQTGCCEAAHGGTLFLDEIGEMPLELQAKLLRFLQDRTVTRLGSNRPISVNVRIVSATNRDLHERVRLKLFREDLYYRLNVIPIVLPPLRERPEDIPVLASKFLHRSAVRNGRSIEGFTPEAIAALAAYGWPGNVRQLENVVERLVIFVRDNWISIDQLPQEILQAPPAPPAPPMNEVFTVPVQLIDAGDREGLKPIEVIERQAIESALIQTGGNVAEAARRLGLGQATVYRKIKRYRLLVPRTRGPFSPLEGAASP